MHPTCGGPCRFAGVLPAVTHSDIEGMYFSENGFPFTSTVRMEPSGIKVQPSSASSSCLPADETSVHVSVAGSNIAIRLSNLRPTKNLPSGSTAEGESPMKPQLAGGFTDFQSFFKGS